MRKFNKRYNNPLTSPGGGAKGSSSGGGSSVKRVPIRPGAPGTKMVKNEVPFGGLSKAALKYAARTGARVLADRKGARIIAEKTTRRKTPVTRDPKDDLRKDRGGTGGGNTARKVPLYKLDKAKVTTRGGSSTTVTRGTSAKRAPLTKAERDKLNAVTTRHQSPKELKAAAQARKNAPTRNREAAAPTTSGKRAPQPKPKTINPRLRKSNKARLERSVRDYVEKYPGKGPGKLKSGTIRGKLRESTANAPVPKSAEEEISRNVALKNAEARYRVERGLKQTTIDSRTPRPKELSDREIEILRKVGKRDYSRGEVSPLAQRILDREADRRVGSALKDPRVRAQDVARTKAAIQKTMSDKALAKRAKTIMNKKTFRGKPKK